MKQYQRMFEMETVDLTLADEALSAIARKAIDRKTGARGLRSIMESILLDTMFDLPSLEGVEEVVISREVVEGSARPLYIYADRSDRAERGRRRERLNGGGFRHLPIRCVAASRRFGDAVFASKIRAFLTRSRRDATYSERPKLRTVAYYSGQGFTPALGCGQVTVREPLPANGSPLRQRILRVVRDVHNNKEVGP